MSLIKKKQIVEHGRLSDVCKRMTSFKAEKEALRKKIFSLEFIKKFHILIKTRNEFLENISIYVKYQFL